MTWELPLTAKIGGIEYEIATDYRDILDIISRLQSDKDNEIKSLVALNLFYENYDSIPPEYRQEAANYLSSFINCFEPIEAKKSPKQIDWEQDYNIMSAEINKVAGQEVRLLPYLHWFTFIGYFHTIGEGQLSTICSIRKKLRDKKKLDRWEQEFYKENKSKIDFRRKAETEAVPEQSEKEKRFWALFNGK